MRLRLTLLICGLYVAAGCTGYNIRVTTYLSHELGFPAPRSDIRVGVVTRSEPAEPLLEAEVKRKIEWLLRDRGYAVGPVEDCDYMLTAFFAIDAGTTATRSYPVYHPGRRTTRHLRTCRGEWITEITRLPGRTTYRSRSYTYFTRHLGMTLYHRQRWLAAGEEDIAEAIAWRSDATSRGDSSDLRRVVDYLLVAAFGFFGEDTGKQVPVSLATSDERVRSLREGVRAKPAGGG